MCQRAQGKRVFVEIRGIAKQSLDKVATANIVDQIAEILAAKGIVAHVLHDRTPVGISMGLAQILRGRVRKALE